LIRLQNQRREEKSAAAVDEALRRTKKEEFEKVAAGIKKPYFPKKRELKEVALSARFDMLEKEGGKRAVAKAIQRRRIKLQQKDRKHLPPARKMEADK
jgi:ribosomal RNA-processing protein 36